MTCLWLLGIIQSPPRDRRADPQEKKRSTLCPPGRSRDRGGDTRVTSSSPYGRGRDERDDQQTSLIPILHENGSDWEWGHQAYLPPTDKGYTPCVVDQEPDRSGQGKPWHWSKQLVLATVTAGNGRQQQQPVRTKRATASAGKQLEHPGHSEVVHVDSPHTGPHLSGPWNIPTPKHWCLPPPLQKRKVRNNALPIMGVVLPIRPPHSSRRSGSDKSSPPPSRSKRERVPFPPHKRDREGAPLSHGQSSRYRSCPPSWDGSKNALSPTSKLQKR